MQEEVGWCSTVEPSKTPWSYWKSTSPPWDWATQNTNNKWECKKGSAGAVDGVGSEGNGRHICMSGKGETCDGSSPNNGWTGDLPLGNSIWDYAMQSAPNHRFYT